MQRRVDEWLNIWQDLKKCLLPNRLKLSFICDVADYETAVAVTEPFFSCSQDPRLRLADCTIRLGRRTDSALSLLARRAVTVAVSGEDVVEDAASSFRFQDIDNRSNCLDGGTMSVYAQMREVKQNAAHVDIEYKTSF